MGTSLSIFKDYFRLTSVPNLNEVRPANILKKTLKQLIQKCIDGSEYSYI